MTEGIFNKNLSEIMKECELWTHIVQPKWLAEGSFS